MEFPVSHEKEREPARGGSKDRSGARVLQVAQALRINDELAHIAPKSVGPADAAAAVFNLYGNYTLTQIPPPMAFQNFIPGVRVQILNNEIFFAPVRARAQLGRLASERPR